jgi:hypothetical protein
MLRHCVLLCLMAGLPLAARAETGVPVQVVPKTTLAQAMPLVEAFRAANGATWSSMFMDSCFDEATGLLRDLRRPVSTEATHAPPIGEAAAQGRAVAFLAANARFLGFKREYLNDPRITVRTEWENYPNNPALVGTYRTMVTGTLPVPGYENCDNTYEVREIVDVVADGTVWSFANVGTLYPALSLAREPQLKPDAPGIAESVAKTHLVVYDRFGRPVDFGYPKPQDVVSIRPAIQVTDQAVATRYSMDYAVRVSVKRTPQGHPYNFMIAVDGVTGATRFYLALFKLD